MPRITGSLDEHRAATRERVLVAVREIMAKDGVDRLSMAEVASRSGLNRSVVYNYFPDVRALIIAHAEHETTRFTDELHRALAGAAGPTERITMYVRQQLADFAAYPQPAGPELATLLGPDGYREMHAHVRPLGRLLTEMIEDGVETGEFAPCDPAGTAHLVLACLGAERYPLGQGARDLDETVARVTTFVLRSLGAATPG
ncbi:TetR/AcrR family transcriptional regulator [Actinomadura decatromicini]|uniref:TetR/AcrR family transcriptional regulator n=1 Tax=Actinomadura decatromicini TaxID=2604572 RepID=A0A5D3FTZ5_9ACTN|nr:TetR/AcrR family transcriptional regulator [Actinomadura decatromicini]TYK51200.1 TetR/AcrR family transcriptional regulator [Actinomadura decatromicini]